MSTVTTSGLAQGSVPVSDSTSSVVASGMKVDTSGNLAVGAAVASTTPDMVNLTTTGASGNSGVALHISGKEGFPTANDPTAGSIILIDSTVGTGSLHMGSVIMGRIRNASTGSGRPINNDPLLTLHGTSQVLDSSGSANISGDNMRQNGRAWNSCGTIQLAAAEDWTEGSHGTKMTIGLTPSGQVIENTVLTIGSDGTVTIPGNVTVEGSLSAASGEIRTKVSDTAYALRLQGATGTLRMRPYQSASLGAVVESANAAENTYLPLTLYGSMVQIGGGIGGVHIGTTVSDPGLNNLAVDGGVNVGSATGATSGQVKASDAVMGFNIPVGIYKYSRQTLSGATSAVFSIPANALHAKFVLFLRSAVASTNSYVLMTVNAIASGYQSERIAATATTPVSNERTAATADVIGYVPGATSPANYGAPLDFNIFNIQSANGLYPSWITQNAYSTGTTTGLVVYNAIGGMVNTAAVITSVTFSLQSGAAMTGTIDQYIYV